MKDFVRVRAPFWRVREARVVRPELWAMAVMVVGMLLVEVWQSARMTELGRGLEDSRQELTEVRSRLAFDRARLERGLNRSELGPMAADLGLAPVDGAQQIELPAGYLERASRARTGRAAPALAWLDRVSSAFVPEATARGR